MSARICVGIKVVPSVSGYSSSHIVTWAQGTNDFDTIDMPSVAGRIKALRLNVVYDDWPQRRVLQILSHHDHDVDSQSAAAVSERAAAEQDTGGLETIPEEHEEDEAKDEHPWQDWSDWEKWEETKH